MPQPSDPNQKVNNQLGAREEMLSGSELSELIQQPQIDPLRQEMMSELLGGNVRGVQTPDKGKLIKREALANYQHLIDEAMRETRGNVWTDTVDVADSWWSGLEVGVGKLLLTGYEATRVSLRELVAFPLKGPGFLKGGGAVRDIFDKHIWDAEPTVLHEVVEDWEERQRLAEQRLMGETGGLRDFYRGSVRFGLGLAEFMGVGMTRAGGKGVQLLLGMHANELSRDVYKETGHMGQAISAGALNYIVSNLIFSRAHKPVGRITKEADKVIKGFDMSKSIQVQKLITAGRFKAASITVSEVMGVTATATVLREIEYGLNYMAQEYIAGEKYRAFEGSYENFFAVMKSGAMEGLTISLLPVGIKATAAIGKGKTNLQIKQAFTEIEAAKNASTSMRSLTRKLSELVGAKDVAGLRELHSKLDTYPTDNLFLKQIKEVIKKHTDALESGKTGEVEIESIKGSLVELDHSARLQSYGKLKEVLDGVVGEHKGSDAPPLTSAEKKGFVARQKHETTEGWYDRLYNESAEALTETAKADLPAEVRKRMDESASFKLRRDQVAAELYELESQTLRQSLVEELAEIGATPKTPATERRKEIVEELLKEVNSALGSDVGRGGKLEADVEVKTEWEGKTLGAKDVLDILDKRKTSKPITSEKRAELIELLREQLKLPADAKGIEQKIKSALKKSMGTVGLGSARAVVKKVLDRVVEGKVEKITLEEAIAELEARETTRARYERESLIRKAEVATKAAVNRLLIREGKRIKAESKTEWESRRQRYKLFMDVLKEAGLTKAQREHAVAKAMTSTRGKVLESPASLHKAVNAAVESTMVNVKKTEIKRLKKVLRERKKDASIGAEFDNVVTALISKFLPEHAKKHSIVNKKNLNDSLNDYVEMRGAHVKESVKLVRDLAKKDLADLSAIEATYLAQFLEGFARQHGAKRKALEAQRVYKRDMVIRDHVLNVASRWNLGKHDIKYDALGNVTGVAEWVKDIQTIGKQFTYGIEAVSRLTDAVEYISGSNNTMSHDILVKDVIRGKNESTRMLARAHRLWEQKVRDAGLTPEMLYELSDANTAGFKSGKNILSIDVEGASFNISRAKLIEYFKHTHDASTLEILKNETSGLDLGTEGSKSVKWGREQHNALMERVAMGEFAMEMKVAKLMVDLINDVSIVGEFRNWATEYYGYDIVSGNTYVPRQRAIKNKEAEYTKKDPHDITSLVEEYVGIKERDVYNVDITLGKKRTDARRYDIKLNDGVISTARYLRSVSILTKLHSPLREAMSIVKDTRFTDATSQKGPIREIANNLVENYYEPMIRQESAVLNNRSQLDAWIGKARNNIVKAVLFMKPTIPLYQPLSEIAAAEYLGKGGQLLMARANMQMGLGRVHAAAREAATNRMLENSGLAWERFQIANSYMLMAGEGMQAKHQSLTIANSRLGKDGKKVSMITRADRHAIIRIYRATELKVENIFRNKGLEVDYNAPMFKEMVRRTFEDVVIETQPEYNPINQPAIINKAKDSVAIGMTTMFRGYTGKLAAMQRISITRAMRALEAGNIGEANFHIMRAAKMTLVGSGFVAVIRKLVKSTIKAGIGVAAFGMLPDTDKEEMLDYGKETLADMLGQMTGMTVGGGFITDIGMPLLGQDKYAPSLSPFVDMLNSFMQSSSSLMTVDPRKRTTGGNLKTAIKFLKTSGAFLGIPTMPWEMLNDTIKMAHEKKVREYKDNLGVHLGP